MSDFRAVAHLEEQLGEVAWRVLIDSANTGKVKEFCDGLVAAILPTTMTICGRTYDILSFLRGETSVKGDVMVERAKEMQANQGEEEREHLLKYQDDIPVALRGQVAFVFTDDRRPGHPGSPEGVYYVCWYGGRWVRDWDWPGSDWGSHDRVLRRKSAP